MRFDLIVWGSLTDYKAELERLTFLHTVFLEVNDGRLHHASIQAGSIILDLCAGNGDWCMDMGDLYPAAEIFGVDLSPGQPTWVPPNISFQVMDVEDEAQWTWRRKFDYIHSRYNTGNFRDPRMLFTRCYNSLQERGRIECVDFDILPYSEDGSLTEEHSLSRWCAALREGAKKRGTSLRFGKELESWLRSVGFTNVQAVKRQVPIGSWQCSEKYRSIGRLIREQLKCGLEGMSYTLILEGLGWPFASLELLLAGVREDLDDLNIHAVIDL